MSTQYVKAKRHMEERKHAFKIASKHTTTMFRELHDTRIALNDLEKNIPILEKQLERMKAALPKAQERVEVLKKSFIGAQKRRKTAEEKLTHAVKRFSIIKKLFEIEKEIENVDS